jgi:threonine synthase
MLLPPVSAAGAALRIATGIATGEAAGRSGAPPPARAAAGGEPVDAVASGRQRLRCVACGAEYATGPLFLGCPRCREQGRDGPLDLLVDTGGAAPARFRSAMAQGAARNIWRYADLLPAVDDPLSLDEGGTPLTPLPHLSRDLGLRLFVKNETLNPTWSFKDRYAAVAVSVARQLGYARVLCASTGNFGQAVAAYAARGGLRCLVLCPPTASELARRAMRLHGADVVATPKEGRPELIRRLVADHGWCPMTGADPEPVGNPFGMAGYKTIAYEIAAQLGGAPDSVLVPVGGGDCLYGIWRGFAEQRDLGLLGRAPRMVGCQTHAAAPLARAAARGLDVVEPVPEGPSAAVSIVEGRCGLHALRAVRASGGTATAATEAELAEATRLLAREGLFPEAASAASLAGALALHRRGYFPPGAPVVCVLTGAGIKWPEVLAGLADPGASLAEASLDALAAAVPL